MSGYTDFNAAIIDEFRTHDGNTQQFGDRLVLVHHLGAKSGTERVTPVMTFPGEDGAWLIAASKAGAPDNPAWYHNLKAHPEVTIEVPREGSVEVRVEELTGDARDAAWAQFTSSSPGFAEYERRTSRTIPVLALHRR
ncbi:nitroreductase family deazaflavin-dependent oxidoreductase [Demequina sp. NBRC 110056]|uniref:nitroreductase family deazaflavin-dependent oxidoreductase n=1 Tax=Demequina sp. NBRC 110056 TaxID=1570345 RepID=UPI000A0020E0|nr:nitroreductase family deazaflavin-dependent oxidoreductase [Demequina sp. NBRC 110056]